MTPGLVFAAIALSAFTWWSATGAVLWLGRTAPAWHGTASLALGVPTFMAVLLVVAVRDTSTIGGASAGFLGAVAIWAWHEAAFLFGHMLGPRREPCPASADRRTRFRFAFSALRDHELALFATLGVLAALSWGATNTVALQTFTALWLCRLAAKLCIFEGVPTMAHHLMPERLAHLKTYFGQGRPRVAFALAMLGMAGALGVLCHAAATAPSSAHGFGAVLVATLVGLAMVEHAFMVLPVRDERLWAWATAHSGREGEGACVFRPQAGRARRLQGVALKARAVVPARRTL